MNFLDRYPCFEGYNHFILKSNIDHNYSSARDCFLDPAATEFLTVTARSRVFCVNSRPLL